MTAGSGALVRGKRHANGIGAARHLTNSNALQGHGRLVDERLKALLLLPCQAAVSKKHKLF